MIQYNLDNNISIELPEHARELKFRQFIDMKATEQAFYADDTFGYAAIPVILASALGDLVVNMLDIYIPASSDNMRKIEPKFLSIDDEFDTLSVYCHLLYVIESYKPDSSDNIIEWHGEKFYLLASDIIKGEGKIKVGPAIVALELSKHFQGLIDKKGDSEGNYAFSLGLLELATLARKENEMLPLNMNERDKWLAERGKLFEEIPLSEILKVRFFFLRTLRGYIKTLDIQLSGRYHNSILVQQPKKWKPKLKRKRYPHKNRKY